MSLCLDTQSELALRTRDYRVVARVTGWYNLPQESRQAAPGCPAYALGWTLQAQSMCICKLEVRVADFMQRGQRQSDSLGISEREFKLQRFQTGE